jgi:hypothetical protein
MSNANILFDRDTFDGISACQNCYEGRLTVRGNNNTSPVGVAVTNSHFGNAGESDGVQIVGKAYGVKIGPGNEFSGITQGSYSRHVDSIQLYGSRATQIVGNYFHDDDTIIMAPDGGDHEYVAHNVMVGGGYAPAVQFGHHDGSSFIHNTIKNIDVNAYVDGGDPDPNRNVVLRDNVAVNGSLNASGCQGCTVSYNLYSTSGKAGGSNSQVGTPAFVGGPASTTYAGWALKAGSPGKGNASDGTDRGIDPSAGSSGSASAGGGAGGGAGTTPGTAPGATGQNPASIATTPAGAGAGAGVTTLPVGAAVGVTLRLRPSKPVAGRKVLLIAPKTKAGGRTCVWRVAKGVTRKGCTIAVRFKRPGVKRITVRITDRSGAVVHGTRIIRVVRAAKRHRD